MGVRNAVKSLRGRWDRYWDEHEEMMRGYASEGFYPGLTIPMIGGVGYPGIVFPGLFTAQMLAALPRNQWLPIGEGVDEVLGKMATVDLCEDASATADVTAGTPLLVILKEIPSSGYSHELPELPAGVSIIGDSFQDISPQWEPDVEHAKKREALGDEGLAGGDAKRGLILFFAAPSADEIVVKIVCSRPWEPADDPNISEKTLTVHVKHVQHA